MALGPTLLLVSWSVACFVAGVLFGAEMVTRSKR